MTNNKHLTRYIEEPLSFLSAQSSSPHHDSLRFCGCSVGVAPAEETPRFLSSPGQGSVPLQSLVACMHQQRIWYRVIVGGPTCGLSDFLSCSHVLAPIPTQSVGGNQITWARQAS